jgi:hypothetical protein
MKTLPTATPQADQDLLLSLALDRGTSDTRAVTVLAQEIGPEGDTVLGELKFKAEFRIVSLEKWREETEGMTQDEMVKLYTVAVWELPTSNGSRTTREQYIPQMLDLLLEKNWRLAALFSHLVQVRDGQKVSELHKALRRGN